MPGLCGRTGPASRGFPGRAAEDAAGPPHCAGHRPAPGRGELGAWSRNPVRLGPRQGPHSIPHSLGNTPIGWILVGDGAPSLAPDSRVRLETALSLLARTASELCQHEVELRHRIKEVAALTRMSSLLVRAAGPDKVLEVALDSALDVLGLDAGSIMLLKEDADGVSADNEADLFVKASRNLSQDWLNSPLPLSKDRVFDRLALSGQTVIVEDPANDPRIQIPERAAAEKLAAAIHVGMVFKNRPQGVIRLYSRRPRGFDEGERRLLASLAEQAAAALEQSRLIKFEHEEQRVQRQLQLAADVQRRMLPRSIPSIPRLDMAARYVPSFELGGDFYDFVDLSGHLGAGGAGDVARQGDRRGPAHVGRPCLATGSRAGGL